MPLDVDIQRRLHDEVCRVFGNDLDNTSSITLDILNDVETVPLLEAVATETLRCATVGGIISRRCELYSASDGHGAKTLFHGSAER
jgi:hypothetical protein